MVLYVIIYGKDLLDIITHRLHKIVLIKKLATLNQVFVLNFAHC